MAIQCSVGGTYLSCNPGTGFPNSQSALTLMGWINYNAWPSAASASMFGLYDGTATASVSPTTAIQIGARNVANQLYAWTWGGNALVNTTAGSPTFTNGVWYHVAYTCTALTGGTQTHTLFVNGAQVASNQVPNVAANLTQVYVNGYPQTLGGTGESSATIIDGISIYNRILSIQEIQTIYNCAGMRDGITYGLIARYSLNESNSGNVTTCYDYSINRNNLISGTGTALTYTTGTAFQNKRF